MSAPRLSVPLVLENAARVPDSMGGYRQEWAALGILYAQLRAGSAGDRAGEVGAASVVVWTITVRAARQGDPRRPQARQRFRMGERIFRIDAVAEADTGGLWLNCYATEERLA